MKRTRTDKTQNNPKVLPTRKGLTSGRTINLSISSECLQDKSTKEVLPRKASTPNHDKTGLWNSSEISCIQVNDAKPSCSRNTVNSVKPKSSRVPETGVQKEISLQDEIDIQYAMNLRAIFKNELEKSRSSKIDSDLINIQQKIEEHEKKLKKTTERLKNVSFNKEVDDLHKLQNPSYGKILESLDKTNCEEYISKLNTKLEQAQNQLAIKNIELPRGGGAELSEILSETLSAFEKLKTDHDVETQKALKEVKDINKDIIQSLTRCKDNLSTCEDLLLDRATLEISTNDIS